MLVRRHPYSPLEKRIGYRFRDRRHLETALLHRSFRYENSDVSVDNQRLEFLGDAALEFVAAAWLFAEFPEEEEGTLTAYRSRLTSGKSLSGIGSELKLGEFIKLGRGEARTGGKRRASNLADALESIMGAAYLDGGMRAVEKIFRCVFKGRLESLEGDPLHDNPKGKLQELCQRDKNAAPQYTVVKREGPPHETRFTVEVKLPDGRCCLGTARSKREAEMRAARAALETEDAGNG